MAATENSLRALGADDSIDVTTFEQILEMDDDDEREFSKGIVHGFLEQAESTFSEMDASLEKKDLDTLSSLGHFLKGSSATLGLTQIKQSCEKIQHWGARTDETGEHSETNDYCLEAIEKELVKLRNEFKEVARRLKRFYGEES